MLGDRLKRFRFARGMSLDDLVAAIDGQVSKQALSKYERGKMQPSPAVFNRIAAALGVKSVQLWGEPICRAEPLAYRKQARLGKKKQQQLESYVAELLEKRIAFQERIGELPNLEFPFQAFTVRKLDDVEDVAIALRRRWKLGVAPIANLVNLLEDHFIHVMEVDAVDHFDGICAVARDGEDSVLSAAIAVRRVTCGARHRLNVAHELGHLTLELGDDIDAEAAAFRLGAAFLAPAIPLNRDAGHKRSHIPLEELVYLKRRYGLSIQAILRRLKDLGVITVSHYRRWCMDINKLGWKKREPIKIPLEKPERFFFAGEPCAF